MEKKSHDQVDAGWKLIEQAQKITLLTHEKPDGDGVSACTALAAILETLGKQVETVYPNQPEYIFKRQPNHVLVGQHRQTPDLLIALDTANADRMYLPDAFKTIPLLNIDHHISNSIAGTVNIVNPTASSACEELYFFIEHQAAHLITPFVAECILYGILCDTQLFYTQLTSARTLRVASELLERGAQLQTLKRELELNKSPDVVMFWGYLMNKIQVLPNKKACYVAVTRGELERFAVGQIDGLTGFINFLAQMVDSDITILFYETEDRKVKASLRSRETDVNQLAAQFGGGGHKNAAGITSTLPITKLVLAIEAELKKLA